VAIVDSSGTIVVEYHYDAWGKPISSVGWEYYSDLARLNPFRYRGYVYDSETGLYYLRSRYYNPDMCRFVNADSVIHAIQILGSNPFVYCINNPVVRRDASGQNSYYVVINVYDPSTNPPNGHFDISILPSTGEDVIVSFEGKEYVYEGGIYMSYGPRSETDMTGIVTVSSVENSRYSTGRHFLLCGGISDEGLYEFINWFSYAFAGAGTHKETDNVHYWEVIDERYAVYDPEILSYCGPVAAEFIRQLMAVSTYSNHWKIMGSLLGKLSNTKWIVDNVNGESKTMQIFEKYFWELDD